MSIQSEIAKIGQSPEETLPPQTLLDSALDFAEYMAGLALAILVIAL